MSYCIYKVAARQERVGALLHDLDDDGLLEPEYKNGQEPPEEKRVTRLKTTKRTFLIQIFFASFFLCGFLLYIPIGLALMAPSKRLSISEVSLKKLFL